jgi:hypothetical protein
MVELIRKSASATNGGELDSSVTQVIPGAKTFSGALTPAGGIVGKTDGVTVPAGYVGQVIQVTGASTTGLNATVSNITNITLTPGVWLITAAGFIGGSGGTSLSLAVSTNSASFTGTIIGYTRLAFPANATAGIASGSLSFPVNIASNTTYYFVGDTNMTALSSGAGSLTAVRIA